MLKCPMEDSFTFDDVLLLPGYSKVLPGEVSVKAKLLKHSHETSLLLSTKMDTVTKHQTAICMSQ